MDPVVTAAALTAGATAVSGWARMKVQSARENARIEHLRILPPGSRLLDLGENGLLIEVGDEQVNNRSDYADGA
ncbi:MAG: hypothetical protein HOW97_23355 [Catenulispora sp.]|nr:hypothetical protein [Catenulispora sp.]